MFLSMKNREKIYFSYNLIDDKQEDVDAFIDKLIKKGYKKSYNFDQIDELTYQVFEKK